MLECIPGLLFLGLIGFKIRLDAGGEKQKRAKEYLGKVFLKILNSIEAIIGIGALCLVFYIGWSAVAIIRAICCIVAVVREK